MLVLTRRCHERIFIGENIIIELLGFDGNRARIGIDAPKDINIVREELLDRDENDDGLFFMAE